MLPSSTTHRDNAVLEVVQHRASAWLQGGARAISRGLSRVPSCNLVKNRRMRSDGRDVASSSGRILAASGHYFCPRLLLCAGPQGDEAACDMPHRCIGIEHDKHIVEPFAAFAGNAVSVLDRLGLSRLEAGEGRHHSVGAVPARCALSNAHRLN